MAVDLRRDPSTRKGALARVGEQLGINPETLRNRVTQAEGDAGDRPGTTTSDAQRLAELERDLVRPPQLTDLGLQGLDPQRVRRGRPGRWPVGPACATAAGAPGRPGVRMNACADGAAATH